MRQHHDESLFTEIHNIVHSDLAQHGNPHHAPLGAIEKAARELIRTATDFVEQLTGKDVIVGCSCCTQYFVQGFFSCGL